MFIDWYDFADQHHTTPHILNPLMFRPGRVIRSPFQDTRAGTGDRHRRAVDRAGDLFLNDQLLAIL